MRQLRTVSHTAVFACLFAHLATAQARHHTPGHAPAPSHAAQPSLQSELAAAKAAGLPTTAAELQAPLPPADQNAAPVYQQLDKRLTASPFQGTEEQDVSNLIGPAIPSSAQVRTARAILRDHGDILALVHQAAAKPECVFQRDWSQGLLMGFIENVRMRSAARWLTAEAYLHAIDGQRPEAVRTQALVFQIARHAAQTPTQVANFAALAIGSIGLGGMERLLDLYGGDPAVVQAAGEAIDRWKVPSLAYALRGDYGVLAITIPMLRERGPELLTDLQAVALDSDSSFTLPGTVGQAWARGREAWSRFVDTNGAVLLRRARLAAAAGDLPYPQAESAMRTAASAGGDAYAILAKLIGPPYSLIVTRHSVVEARLQVDRGATAVLALRAQHRAWPASLAAVATPPTDPFSGRPVVFRVEGDGFVVYSVGESGKFTGGDPDHKPARTEILFRYPTPDYLRPSAG